MEMASSTTNLAEYLQSRLDGNPSSMNFDCDIKEQRQNLAYNYKRDIDRSSFEVGEQIGKGNFGKVEKGLLKDLFDRESKTIVAIK